MPELSHLQGELERITYHNEENGYTVARIKVPGRSELVTITGALLNPTPGELLKLQGHWSQHPKFGEQFQVHAYQCLVPATVTGIRRYLGSGLIKGIGPEMAKRIVSAFGAETLEIIEGDLPRLAQVEGIGPKRLEMIGRAWQEQKEIRSVMLFLQSHGVSSGYATKIYRVYGDQAIKIVGENPYRLANDVYGIGFITADKIAQNLGLAHDSPYRAQAGILYVLHQLSDEGHVYYPRHLLNDKCQEILQVPQEIIEEALETIASEGRVVLEPLTGGETAVFLAKFHYAERQLAKALLALREGSKSFRSIDTTKALQWVSERLSIQLATGQEEAIISAASEKVLVITGGPGTGKTTIINAILQILGALKIKILLAAPTGRAAKRMTEATGLEARTIHRLLEFAPGSAGFSKNEENPLACDLLVVDEASMIDTLLMHHLLRATPSQATLILVGDVNQLPSVGAGNVLGDIIASGTIPVVRLNQIFRQAQESAIIVNAHKINEGQFPDLKSGDGDFHFFHQEDPGECVELIISLVKERIPRRFGYHPTEEIQVLTPMHRGLIGAGNLNTALQEALNPRGEKITFGSRSFRVGDKVMQIRNNYEKEVFNGDIGRVLRIQTEEREVIISFDGKDVAYDYSELDELVLAYAVSVHKSQGSEYPVVVMPVHTQHFMLLQRNLLYTAITRGKKLVVLVGTTKALAIAVRNDKTEQRFTLLRKRLQPKEGAAEVGSLPQSR